MGESMAGSESAVESCSAVAASQIYLSNRPRSVVPASVKLRCRILLLILHIFDFDHIDCVV